jgi:hypothetical protein
MNEYIGQRLSGLQKILMGAYDAGGGFASANKGDEREVFVTLFLQNVLPPMYRFGSGEITDAKSPPAKSGQLDVVIEMPWVPSFALPFHSSVRLYPAEAVGAVIEVKSNIADQFSEVAATAAKLAPLSQTLNGTSVVGGALELHVPETAQIPLYAVGFKGWATAETIGAKLLSAELDGILVIDSMQYVEVDRSMQYAKKTRLQRYPACERILNLPDTDESNDAIAKLLNDEGIAQARVHIGDNIFLPNIEPGGWTTSFVSEIREIRDNLGPHVRSYTGEQAILRFIDNIHQEVSKRSSMWFDITPYAGTGANN